MVWLILLNILGFFILYFLLRHQLQKNIGIEKQLNKIRIFYNELSTDMNDAVMRNTNLLEQRIKEAKKLTRQLSKEIRNTPQQEEEPSSLNQSQPQTQPSIPLEQTPSFQNLKETILKLHQKGVTPLEIVDILGCQLEEVELVISLEKSKNQ